MLGAEPVAEEEEKRRVLPVIEDLAKEAEVPLSVDTYHAAVAEAALQKGASVVNDISGLRDKAMIDAVNKYDVPVVIMHMQGTPGNMQVNPSYKDVVSEIYGFFEEKIKVCDENGIDKVILDPGIGFGKTVEHNLAILKGIPDFKKLGKPLLIGTSRKSFIGKILGIENPEDRLIGTIACDMFASRLGADILRVHDVKLHGWLNRVLQ